MRSLAVFLLFVSTGFAADPATLHVDLIDGKYLSFKLENRYREPVTSFAVESGFGDHSLTCALTVQVKRPEDLRPKGTCSLPVDVSTGRVAQQDWKARIVYVEFANGMRWTPVRLP